MYVACGGSGKNVTTIDDKVVSSSKVLHRSTEKMKADVPCSGADNVTTTDNKVVLSFPAINLGGATNFTINFNIGNKN